MKWFSLLKDSNFGFFPERPKTSGFSEGGRNKDWVNLSNEQLGLSAEMLSDLNRIGDTITGGESKEWLDKYNKLSEEIELDIINQIVDTAVHESAHRAVKDIQGSKQFSEETIIVMNDYISDVSNHILYNRPISSIQPVLTQVKKFAEWQVLDEVYAQSTSKTEQYMFSDNTKIKEVIINKYVPKFIKKFENTVNSIISGWVEGLEEINQEELEGKVKEIVDAKMGEMIPKMKEIGESYKQAYRESSNSSANRIKG